MERPTWDEQFYGMARLIARRATCDRAHVGAVIADQSYRVVSMGYNGAPEGTAHCDKVGHLMIDGGCRRAVHAEANAIVNAARAGVRTAGCILYVTHSPCLSCLSMLINAGIEYVCTEKVYRMTASTAALYSEAGIFFAVWNNTMRLYVSSDPFEHVADGGF